MHLHAVMQWTRSIVQTTQCQTTRCQTTLCQTTLCQHAFALTPNQRPLPATPTLLPAALVLVTLAAQGGLHKEGCTRRAGCLWVAYACKRAQWAQLAARANALLPACTTYILFSPSIFTCPVAAALHLLTLSPALPALPFPACPALSCLSCPFLPALPFPACPAISCLPCPFLPALPSLLPCKASISVGTR